MEIPELLTLIKKKVTDNKHLDDKNKAIVLHILKQVFVKWREDEYHVVTNNDAGDKINNNGFNFLKDTIFGKTHNLKDE